MADGSAAPLIAASTYAPTEGIDVVYFAGAGGSSEAYKLALRRSPDVALNHKTVAIGIHMANHPETEHMIADVFDIDPRCVRPGVKWRSFWASPDCRDFSKAKGSAPVSPRVRGLCWIVIKVAKLLGDLAPDVIFVENVEEFVDYGPLLPPDEQGRQYRDPKHKGRSFRTFVKRLRQCGYTVEWTVDWVMARHGVATTRKRFLLIARRDGKRIRWAPETHAPRAKAAAKGLKPYRPASDFIDFSIPCPSIFLTQEECNARGIKARRPLVPATMARIAKGLYRWVISASVPFTVPVTHQGDDRSHPVSEPLRTITTARRGEFALISPIVTRQFGMSIGSSVDDPIGTVTAGGGGKTQLVSACLVPRYGERPGQEPRSRSVEEPYPTVVCTGNGGQLAAVFMEQANTGMVGHPIDDPLSTIVGRGTTQRLIAAHLDYAYGSNQGAAAGDLREPMKTATATGNHHFLVETEMAAPFAPHGEELRAFLLKYYGPCIGQDLDDPLHSVTSRARFGLVVVSGQVMQITDIGMRMLRPHELAGCQGFGRGYQTGWNALTSSAVTLEEEIAGIGNSVSPEGAAPHIAVNLGTPADIARLGLPPLELEAA